MIWCELASITKGSASPLGKFKLETLKSFTQFIQQFGQFWGLKFTPETLELWTGELEFVWRENYYKLFVHIGS